MIAILVFKKASPRCWMMWKRSRTILTFGKSLRTKEFKGLVHGDYGKTPAPISAEFTKKILGDEKPITCRFADTLAPEMDKLKAEAAKWAIQEEDVLTYAMFPQVAPKFFEKRNAKAQGVDADHADFANKSHPV